MINIANKSLNIKKSITEYKYYSLGIKDVGHTSNIKYSIFNYFDMVNILINNITEGEPT